MPGGGILLCSRQQFVAVFLDFMVQHFGSLSRARQCSAVVSLAVITAAVCQCSGTEANASCAAACWSAHAPFAILTWAEACFFRDGDVCNIKSPAGR